MHVKFPFTSSANAAADIMQPAAEQKVRAIIKQVSETFYYINFFITLKTCFITSFNISTQLYAILSSSDHRQRGGDRLIITIRVSDLDGALIKRYAAFNKETVSSILKRLIMEQIESDYIKLLGDRKPAD